MNCARITAVVDEGRFGNLLLHYVAGRAIAEVFGLAYRVSPWIGDVLFDLTADQKWAFGFRPKGVVAYEKYYHTDLSKWEDCAELLVPPFFLLPKDVQGLISSRYWMTRYLHWLPGWDGADMPHHKHVLHLRRGDFVESGMPFYSAETLVEATRVDLKTLVVVEEGKTRDMLQFPWPVTTVLVDFHTLLRADNCYTYPNSTFSLVAGLLGKGQVMRAIEQPDGKLRYFPIAESTTNKHKEKLHSAVLQHMHSS